MLSSKLSTEKGSLAINELQEQKDSGALISIVESSKNASDVKKAIVALGTLKDAKAVDVLICALLSKFISIRHSSVFALGETGDKRAVKPLLMLLDDEQQEPYFRKAVIGALGSIGDDRAVEPLVKLLNNEEEDIEIRESAVEALGRIGTPEALAAIVQVLGVELDLHSRLASIALSALKKMGEGPINLLLHALANRDKGSRKKAVKALGEIGNKKATKPLLTILAKYSEDDFDLLEEVIRALGKIKDVETVKPLIGALKSNPLHDDKDYCVQNLLIFSLGSIGDNRACKPLVKLLLEAEESRIKWTAAYALAKIGAGINDVEVIEQLVSILENQRQDGTIKQFIAWALFQTEDDKIALPFIKYLRSSFGANLKQILFEESEVKM